MTESKPEQRRRKTHATAGVTKVDRLPPYSIEAEQGVLGCILLSPESCLPECVTKLKAGAEIFYDLRHQELYQTMVDMWDELDQIDLITLHQRLKDNQQLENVGGLAYISALPDTVPSSNNLDYYVEIVLEKYLLRKIIQTCTGMVGRVYDNENNPEEVLDELEKTLLSLRQDRASGIIQAAPELVRKAIATIEEYHQNKGALTGVATGFADFDKMTTGLHEGEMIVIAARPSVGKTSLAMNIAEHAAVEQKIPVGVFSLEMTADQLMLRMLCSRARVNVKNVRDGFLAERDFPKLTGAAGRLSQAKMFIDDTSGLSILQLRARARNMVQMYGIKLFVIDYVQLLHALTKRSENRQQEMSYVSGGIKELAKELRLPVVVLAQLNRELEKRGAGARPRLSDLRETGAIENDADLVGLLFREETAEDAEENRDADAIPVKLFIAKQRNGPTGDVDLTFLKCFTRFESAAKVATEDAEYRQPHPD